MTRQKKNHQKILNTFWDMGDFQNAVFGQKQALFSWPPSSSAFMISIPWAWDVNKYQILVPLIPLKVPKSILEVFKTLPEICSQHLILQSGPTVRGNKNLGPKIFSYYPVMMLVYIFCWFVLQNFEIYAKNSSFGSFSFVMAQTPQNELFLA